MVPPLVSPGGARGRGPPLSAQRVSLPASSSLTLAAVRLPPRAGFTNPSAAVVVAEMEQARGVTRSPTMLGRLRGALLTPPLGFGPGGVLVTPDGVLSSRGRRGPASLPPARGATRSAADDFSIEMPYDGLTAAAASGGGAAGVVTASGGVTSTPGPTALAGPPPWWAFEATAAAGGRLGSRSAGAAPRGLTSGTAHRHPYRHRRTGPSPASATILAALEHYRGLGVGQTDAAATAVAAARSAALQRRLQEVGLSGSSGGRGAPQPASDAPLPAFEIEEWPEPPPPPAAPAEAAVNGADGEEWGLAGGDGAEPQPLDGSEGSGADAPAH